ncbi:regucalcin [Microplitis demolitor]|uniref:regucalcin n=1 Tax=Microplitis demolitor TaxID=69319 RepID=UPI0004CD4B34|nr:regucalcin [Microplitis demolitor]XP_053597775.1 regucalcin [Microplitis demolitor]XP_053597777.1 regucalcin [Microplitis demolitor]
MKTLRILLIFNLFIISLIFGKCTENLKIEKVTGPYLLAEGPHWDAEKNLLYFVDINSQKILCYNPKTKITTYAYLECGLVSVVVPVAGKKNTFIAGCGRYLVQVIWNPRTNNKNPKTTILSLVDLSVNDTRFNDGKVDPKGRFWGGTMLLDSKVADPPNQASLYRFAYDGTPTTMITPVSVSNGLVWSHTNDSFYYIDSQAYNIVVYDYDDTTGNISNKRILLDLKKNKIEGIPDGMTIDKAGNLWVAINTGGKVIQVDSKNGEVLRSVKMPVTDVSSVAFGGPNKDILYVTTARDKLSEAQIKLQPTAGSVFAVHGLGVTGSPMLACRIK